MVPDVPEMPVPPVSMLGKAQAQVTQMERTRARHIPRWRDVQDYVSPYSADVDQNGVNRREDSSAILDDTILFCRTTLASGLYWGMTNPARQWSEWNVTDPDLRENQAVKEWLHETNARRMALLAGSNFYRTMAWVYNEWPAFANAIVLIEEDDRDVFRYIPWGIGSYAWAEDAKGVINCVSRRFTMTLRQIVERFASVRSEGTGKLRVLPDRLSVNLKKALDAGEWERSFTVYQLVCPNDLYVPNSDLPEDYAYASYYWEESASDADPNGGMLAKEGYREWPFMVFRWETVPGDPWGTDSPGILTLPSNKSAQQMESDALMGVEKLVKPPIVGPPEMVSLNLLPAARNAVQNNSRFAIAPLHDTAPDAIQVIEEKLGQTRERMMALWFTRLMLSFTANPDPSGNRTAREVEEVSQEKYLVLGRVLEAVALPLKQGSEREFAIMQRRGLLPPVPPELDGQPLDIEFTSMLSVAQRSVGVGQMKNWALWAASVAQAAGNPAMLDKVDFDQLLDETSQREGIPPRVVRSDESVAEMRRAQAEAAQAQQQMELAEKEAKAVKDLAAAPVREDNALGRLLNAGQAAPF